MNKTLNLIVFMLISFISFSNTKKNILYINSYHPSFPTFPRQVKGLKQAFKNEDVILDIEYIDSKRFTHKSFTDSFFNNIKYKIKNLEKYDLIITSDDNATDFVKNNYETLFKGIPVVFFGVNDQKKALAYNQDPNFTGYYEVSAISETISIAKSFFPKAKTIYVISDATVSSKGDLIKFNKIIKDFPKTNFKILNLNTMSFKAFYEKLESLDNDNILILLSAYSDTNGKNLRFNESLKEITNHTELPIFHLWEHGLGNGILGGKLISHYEYAYTSGKTALSILNKKKYTDPHLDLTVYSFDYNKLKEYKINKNLIPKNSKIINLPYKMRKPIKNIIISFTTATIILITITIALITIIIKMKKTKKELKENQIKYENLFENLPLSALELDFLLIKEDFQKLKNQGIDDFEKYISDDPVLVYQYYSMIKLVDLNKATLNLYQSSNKEELMENLLIVLSEHKFCNLKKLLVSFWNKNNEISYNTIISNLLGKEINVLIKGIFYNSSRCILTIQDINTQILYQNSLLEAKHKADEANKSKSNFLANMTHELRTPLTGIVGMLDLLSLTKLSSEQNDYLKTLNSSSEKLIKVINGILDLSKIENGKFQIENESFVFEDFFYTLVDSFSFNIEKKGIHFYLYVDPHIFTTYIGDSFKINQILSNLIGNALKFTEEGFISLKVELLNSEKYHDEILFIVSDTGSGISEDNIHDIFDPFIQDNQNYSKNPSGTGLGLSISQNLVKLMGGELKVESSPSYGSSFSFNLKLKKSKYIKRKKSLKNIKIALFSDNNLDLAFIKDLLIEEGAILSFTHTKESFHSILNSFNFDFVIVNYINFNWYDQFTRLNKNICFFISNSDKKNLSENMKEIPYFILKKPIKRSDLISLIKREL